MVSLNRDGLTGKVLAGERISVDEVLELYRRPLDEVGALANARRDLAKAKSYAGRGREIVTYIVDRNINYTNVCNVYCKFCAFYRTEKDEDHYVLSFEQIDQKLDELSSVGGVQILMQGGHHPKLPFQWYLDLLRHIREKYPHINIHGFSPPEFQHFAEDLPHAAARSDFGIQEGWAWIDSGRRRRNSRGSRAAANFAVEMQQRSMAGSDANQRTSSDLNSSATMMFGHVETRRRPGRTFAAHSRSAGSQRWIYGVHLLDVSTAKLVLKSDTRPASAEYLRMQALARIFLDNIDNVQSSWVTQGPEIGQIALKYGANDFGSVMMEENVVSSAGTTFRLDAGQIESLIRDAGYEPRRRNNWYELLN